MDNQTMQVFSLRLSPEQRRRLDDLAAETDRNASQVLRTLLDMATVGTVPTVQFRREALAETRGRVSV